MLWSSLLGQFALNLDGQPVELSARPAQLLLIYLLLHPDTPHRREKLAGLLWPEVNEANARSNLRGALWRARKALEIASQCDWEYLQVDGQTIELSLQPGDWLDTLVLDAEITQKTTIDELIGMVSAYVGELLPGFYEDWIVAERQQLQAVYERKMGLLLDGLLDQQNWCETLEWGERWIAQGQIPEPAYRALMLAHAGMGDMAGAVVQYQRCVEVLERELGVTPSEQTCRALEEIRAGRVEQTARTFPAENLPAGRPASPPRPVFLSDKAATVLQAEQVFVGREQTLSILDGFLEHAQAGQGRVVFVSGEAGSGKSSLLQAFVRRAILANKELIAVLGACNAFFGQGDAYLPFREALAMLTGDAEQTWTSGLISRDHACRLWALLPGALQAILEAGPDLINTLLPGQALLSRVEAALPIGNPWRKSLDVRLARHLGEIATSQVQSGLFEQYLQVLRCLSRQQTIVIVLDDLQWVDYGSTQLLFHLGRHIQDTSILILGAFRPEEVAAGREDGRHPLEPLLNELRRVYGEICLDLDQIGAKNGRNFVDTLLDSEPNRLDETFRTELYQRTRGQPLFTIQLLRNLQERGEIVLDSQDHWIVSSGLNWEAFPPQVEGVIGERLGRLDPELQEILSIAAVEGEEFTVQIVEGLQGLGGRELLRRFSRDLEVRHRLVRELDEVRIGQRCLVRFRFTHALIQEYLYHQLGESERRALHGEVAAALEELYFDELEAISVQLARHYIEAGERAKAVTYLLQAGDQAQGKYAYSEAIDHYQQALVFQKEQGDTEGAARTLLKLNLVYHSAFDYQQANRVLEEGLALWQRVARSRTGPTLPKATQPYRLPMIQEVILDPGICISTYCSNLVLQLFYGLVELSETMNVIPMAAESWEVQDEGRRYVFRLRQDLRWNDGEPLTAEDFEFAWKRNLDPATQSGHAHQLYDLRGARKFHQGQVSDASQVGVTATDAFTLIIELEEPAGYFPYILGTMPAFAMPKHAIEHYGPTWTQPCKLVSNGAFQLDAWEPGRIMRFSRNPLYHGRFTGNIDQVELISYPDLASVYASFANGELDRMDILTRLHQASPDHYQGTGQLFTHPTWAVSAIYFIIDRPPFDDLRLRRALALAIDREKLANEVLQGFVLPGTGGYVPPACPGHSPGIGLAYNPERAQQLIAAAGFPGGQGFPRLILFVGDALKESPAIPFLSECWTKNLGITFQVEWGDSYSSFLATDNSQNCPFFIDGWLGDYPDPDSYLRANFSLKEMHLQHAKFESLIRAGKHTLDQTARLELYRQADRILTEEAFVVPLFYDGLMDVLQPWVQQPSRSIIFQHYWKDIILDLH